MEKNNAKLKTGITTHEAVESNGMMDSVEASISTPADSTNFLTEVEIKAVMAISDIKFELSPNINVLIGENSTGKTAVLKAIYSVLTGYKDGISLTTKEKKRNCFERKIKHVFRPKDLKIGNIVKKNYDNASIQLEFSNAGLLTVMFGKDATEHISFYVSNTIYTGKQNIVYIPPKEMVSVNGFVPVYDEFKISFEEMYNDLARRLLVPEQRKLDEEYVRIVSVLTNLIGGKVFNKDGEIFLKQEDGVELEMGLISEGYRKIVTLIQLILNGSLKKGDILLWDEPETNMNPRMTPIIVETLVELSKIGIQVIITTHDYFISHEFGLRAKYNNESLLYNFFSFYKEEKEIIVESSNDLFGMVHNAIMDQFDELYDRGNDLRCRQYQ